MAYLTEKYRRRLETAKAIQHGDFALIAEQTGYTRRHIREVVRTGAVTSDEAIELVTEYYDKRLELMHRQTKASRKAMKLAKELNNLAAEMIKPNRSVVADTSISTKTDDR